jgi:hypothetical protein
MSSINYNQILGRTEEEAQFMQILSSFEANKNNLLFKKGIYVYGNPGAGKTMFVLDILKRMNYDVVKYDAGDIRNKSIIDDITERNMSDKNIMSLFKKDVKKIAVLMDEIDGMNNGDKGGINTLIKLIRPKKTKKQKLEELSKNPIICIGNYRIDKKIKELIKVCNVIELKTPTQNQIFDILHKLTPNISDVDCNILMRHIQSDLRKITNVVSLYNANPDVFKSDVIFQLKSYNDDAKKITHNLMNNRYNFEEHNTIMNETDRTSVGLLWHENIIDLIEKTNKKKSIPFYLDQLENVCFADYIDRKTFQNQIWQFNEMSSLIKTMKNNKMYHEHFNMKPVCKPHDVRFTKVLTKYSTEYNNTLFIQNLSQQLGMDKNDLLGYFSLMNENYSDIDLLVILENHEISKLDINRMYRYIDKYTKENALDIKYVEAEEDFDEELIT